MLYHYGLGTTSGRAVNIIMKSTGSVWQTPNRISMTMVLCKHVHYLHCFLTCGQVKLCQTGRHHGRLSRQHNIYGI
ncbi:hypothetical protein BJV82DRAFT_381814 [Fennellomyces sp. T-0311]|nr:hypothetical protein BJV82DRAFT_381814 [Fennellomyces sp. T-0311]